MFGLKRIVFLTFLPIPLIANHVFAGELSPSVEVQKNIIVLLETKNCPQCDLSGANLNRMDLSNANLTGANLSRTKMALANLSGANLQNADLREASFTGTDLANTDLRGTYLTGASFSGAYMVGTLMDGEMLSTTPYAKDEISDIEQSVYVEDTVKSKKPQKTDELAIGTRRDFEETPPAVPAKNIQKKTVQLPPVVTSVDDVTLAYDEVSGKMLPSQSAAAPDSKDAPAIKDVRLQEEVIIPESLPVINETKKEHSFVIKSEEVVVEKELITDDVQVDEAIEKENIVVDTETVSPIEGSVKKEETSVVTEDVVGNNPPEEEPATPIVEVQNVTVEGEVVATAEDKVIEKDIVQSVAETKIINETAIENPEHTGESAEESPGVMQKVLNIFSSAEPATEVLKNAALLLDTKKCYGCNLEGVNLSGANLDGADLEGADLSNAILQNVDLEEANLKGTNLSGADLTGADLSEADLYKADFSGANLTDANLEKALLDDVNFTGVTGYTNSSILLLNAN